MVRSVNQNDANAVVQQIANGMPPEGRKTKSEILQENIRTTDRTLLRPAAGNANNFDLAVAQDYANTVWSSFAKNPNETLAGIHSLRQLMAMLTLSNINFQTTNEKEMWALYQIFHKHFAGFLKKERNQPIQDAWKNFFNHPSLFNPKQLASVPQDQNEAEVRACAINFSQLIEQPRQLLSLMVLLRHDAQLWDGLGEDALKNYATKLRSFVGVTIQGPILKDLLKLLSAPAMANIASEFFFQDELQQPSEERFQQNIDLIETLLLASKNDKNPLACLASIKHKLTTKYLYALFPMVVRIHSENPNILKDFLWQSKPAHGPEAIPMRIMIPDLQQALANNTTTPIQRAIMEHNLIAKEMVYTPELLRHKQQLKETYWFRARVFPRWVRGIVASQPAIYKDVEKTIVENTAVNIDPDQQVKAKYPILYRLSSTLARQKFVKDLVNKPQPDNLNFHHLCAKIAMDPKFGKILKAKDKSGWFNSLSENDAIHENEKLANTSPFFAAKVRNKSITQCFLDVREQSKKDFMQGVGPVKDFVIRQAFLGANTLEKLQLIQQYHLPNTDNPFLKLVENAVDPNIFLQLIKAQLTRLVSEYMPGQSHNCPTQKIIFDQLEAFAKALKKADEQINETGNIYKENGILNFNKILHGQLLIDLVNKGVLTQEHQHWLEFKNIAHAFVNNYEVENRPEAVRRFYAASRSAGLVDNFETAVREESAENELVFNAGFGLWSPKMLDQYKSEPQVVVAPVIEEQALPNNIPLPTASASATPIALRTRPLVQASPRTPNAHASAVKASHSSTHGHQSPGSSVHRRVTPPSSPSALAVNVLCAASITDEELLNAQLDENGFADAIDDADLKAATL